MHRHFDLSELLAVARGDAEADLILADGCVVNVFSGEIERADVAIHGGRIAGVGKYKKAVEVVEARGAYLLPGLIDGHVHVESSLCVPGQFARAVVPRGVTHVVADPHEIANVAGVAGVRAMARQASALPAPRFHWAAPSCVPATDMGTAGATLGADDLARLKHDGVVGLLAEVMNFPGVVQGDPDMLAKLAAFDLAKRDGHAPGLSGNALNAYAAAGIDSDHECTTIEEAAEKLARGMYVLIREATNAHNLDTLLPLVNEKNNRRICFCTDDRTPDDLLAEGSIDMMVRRAIAFGIEPVTAVRMATLNTAERFGLVGSGAIAPGYFADIVLVGDLTEMDVKHTMVGGRLIDADVLIQAAKSAPPVDAWGKCVVPDEPDFRIAAKGHKLRVIGSLEGQLLTEERHLNAKIVDGHAVSDIANDVLKMAVIERHGKHGHVGLGFIQGFGLERGAIAGTVAHDHHNLVVIGADDASMTAAARCVADMHGGLCCVDGDKVLAQLPLPVAGLMSDEPIEDVRHRMADLLAAARKLGSPMHDPFMAMSFMALEVIPKLKITDRGLVDVEAFGFVPLFV
ncbi:MAG: adenine deaminase [Planctomycetota bacterium]